ncbi:MAG: hypothetical protein II265_03590 [Clostridia bacterium]|nr:hypothetical protein [Clostridia bacterium]
MTYAFDMERVRVACAEAERAAADLARHPLADWLAHRVEHLRGEFKDFINATDTETTQTTNTERTNT